MRTAIYPHHLRGTHRHIRRWKPSTFTHSRPENGPPFCHRRGDTLLPLPFRDSPHPTCRCTRTPKGPYITTRTPRLTARPRQRLNHRQAWRIHRMTTTSQANRWKSSKKKKRKRNLWRHLLLSKCIEMCRRNAFLNSSHSNFCNTCNSSHMC